jgi:hypothetical protein
VSVVTDSHGEEAGCNKPWGLSPAAISYHVAGLAHTVLEGLHVSLSGRAWFDLTKPYAPTGA